MHNSIYQIKQDYFIESKGLENDFINFKDRTKFIIYGAAHPYLPGRIQNATLKNPHQIEKVLYLKKLVLKQIRLKEKNIKTQLPKQSITISLDSDLNLIKIKLSNRKAY